MYNGIVKAVADITGEEINSCVDSKMENAIEEWAAMYENQPSWLNKKQGIVSASIPSSLAAEVARLITLELQSDVDDKDVNAIYKSVVDNIRIPTEYACALGGIVFKPYLDGNDKVSVQHIRADRFYPLTFDGSGNITQCVFIEQIRSNKDIYTRLEVHRLVKSTLTIDNVAYKSTTEGLLGNRISLDDVSQWAGLAEFTTYANQSKLPVGFFKLPLANNINPDSPLGVSLFSKAVGLIEEADRKYSNINWEYESKQAAIHIATSLLKPNANGDGCIIPEGKERLYRTLEYSSGATDKPLLDTFSPDIRATDLYMGYQNQLRMIEFACGLSYGTISDPSTADKTATEVKSSKQRLYATVTDIQKALQKALEDTAEAIAFWLKKPKPIVSSVWDDSIIVDSESLQRQKMLEYTSGIIDKVKYFIDVYGMSEESAIKLVSDMESRSPAPENVDFFAEGDESTESIDIDLGEVKEVAEKATGERLNGAQVKSLMEVIAQYSSGALTESAATNLIISAFGMTEQEARKLLGLGDA